MPSNWSVEYRVNPSFDRAFGIRVSGPEDADSLVVTGNILYGSSPGYTTARDPLVTIEIPRVEGERLFASMRTLKVPVVPEFAVGLDGTTYRLRIEHGWNQSSMKWWGNLPTEWSELQQIIDVLTRYVEQHCPRESEGR